jgi:exonuclease SbcC
MKIRLLRLELNNIASYGSKYNSLDFSKIDYPLFVSGPNGAGKTTFFVDGVTFALFGGAYGRGPRGRESPKRLIVPAGKVSAGYIKLEFMIGDKRYRVSRVMRGVGGSSKWDTFIEVYYDGRWRKEYIGMEADRFIISLTGFDYNTFLSSVVVRQGEVFSFIDITDSERRELLLRLLNIELDRYRELVKENLRRSETRLQNIEGRIREVKSSLKYSRIGDLEQDRIKFLDELSNMKSSLKKLEERLESLRGKRNKLFEEFIKLNEIKSRLDELDRDIERCKAELEALGFKGDVDDIDKVFKYYEEIVGLRSDIDKTMSELNKVNDLLLRIQKYRAIENEISRLKNSRDKLIEAASSRGIILEENYVNNLRADEIRLINRNNEIDNMLKILEEKEEAKCPLCGRELDESHREEIRSNLKGEKEANIKSIEELRSIIREWEKYFDELRKIDKKILSKEGEIKALREMVGKYRYDDMVEEKETLERRVELYGGKVDSLISSICEYFESCSKDNLDELVKGLQRYRELVGEMGLLLKERERNIKKFDLERYEYLERMVDELDKSINGIVKDRDKLIGDIAELNNKLRVLDEQTKLFRRLDELNKEREDVAKEKRIWSLLDQYVFRDSMFPRMLLKNIVERYLSDGVNRILSMVFPEAMVKFDVSEGGKGVSLNVFINNIRRDRHTLSGGEKTLIGFAIRLGISTLVSQLHGVKYKPDFLIIDEGFGPLDDENKNRVAEVLNLLVEKEFYRQVIVISHESELKNHPAFRSSVEVYKEKGISRIRQLF